MRDERILSRTQEPMEEDTLDPFAELLADDSDTLQRPDHLIQRFADYGQFYEYTESEFHWDGNHEVPILQSPVKDRTEFASQQSPVKDRTEIAFEPPEFLTEDFAEVTASFVEETRKRDSKPSNGLKGFPGIPPQQDLAPDDSALRNEMLELLTMFEGVYGKNSTPDQTRKLLHKCKSMCEQIMDRYHRIPQVVAMHEQATALLEMAQEEGKNESPSAASPNEGRDSSPGMSVHEHIKAEVQEALERVDAEERDLAKDSDEGEEVDGVYRRKGIWYCKTHTDQEQCEQCGVDYRLLNKLHRENESEDIDATVRKEQERLQEQEFRHNHPEPATEEAAHSPTLVHIDSSEDFQSVAKDLKEELDRAREKEEADFLKYFASFQIS